MFQCRIPTRTRIHTRSTSTSISSALMGSNNKAIARAASVPDVAGMVGSKVCTIMPTLRL